MVALALWHAAPAASSAGRPLARCSLVGSPASFRSTGWSTASGRVGMCECALAAPSAAPQSSFVAPRCPGGRVVSPACGRCRGCLSTAARRVKPPHGMAPRMVTGTPSSQRRAWTWCSSPGPGASASRPCSASSTAQPPSPATPRRPYAPPRVSCRGPLLLPATTRARPMSSCSSGRTPSPAARGSERSWAYHTWIWILYIGLNI